MRYNPNCVDCGIEKTIKNTSYRNKEHTKLSSRCRTCSNKANRNLYQHNLPTQRERSRVKSQLYSNTPMGVLCRVRYEARERGIPFELTLEYFKKNWKKPCHYCTEELKKVGFDRVDSSKGYTEENTVPCCAICNKMKTNMKLEDFISRCRKIVNHYDY